MPLDLIGSLVADLRRFDAERPRAQQTETGASQAGHCRAEAVLRVRGVPESDPRISWQAWVGNAIHERLALARPDLIRERKFTYRGVPCTVDLIHDTTLVDYKTVDSAADFPAEPKRSWLTQVNLGAAAANAEGTEVTEVALLVLPRSGEFEAQLFGPYPLEQQLADEAVEWVQETNRIAAEGAEIDGLRDQPPMWCRQWCPYVTACRGTPEPEQPLDESVATTAAEYDAARTERDKAQARMNDARDLLIGVRGQAGEWKVTTSGGREVTEQVEDFDRVREWWRFVEGDLPTREVTKVTARRLTVKRAS